MQDACLMEIIDIGGKSKRDDITSQENQTKVATCLLKAVQYKPQDRAILKEFQNESDGGSGDRIA